MRFSEKNAWSFFMGRFQLCQSFRAIMRKQCAFNQYVPRGSLHPMFRLRQDARLSFSLSYPVLLNLGSLQVFYKVFQNGRENIRRNIFLHQDQIKWVISILLISRNKVNSFSLAITCNILHDWLYYDKMQRESNHWWHVL